MCKLEIVNMYIGKFDMGCEVRILWVYVSGQMDADSIWIGDDVMVWMWGILECEEYTG